MTKRHWITTKECKEMYNIGVNQLSKLVGHNVVTVKKEKTTGRGRSRNLYNHLQVKIYGKLTRGERRNYMSKLNGTKLGRKTNLPANYAKSFVRSHDEAKSYRENFMKNGIDDDVYKQTYVNKKPNHISYAHEKTLKYKFITGVDNPEHYNPGKISAIDAIEDWELDFSAGNVVKYIVRAGKKNSSQKKKDLQKALWYLIRMLKDE